MLQELFNCFYTFTKKWGTDKFKPGPKREKQNIQKKSSCHPLETNTWNGRKITFRIYFSSPASTKGFKKKSLHIINLQVILLWKYLCYLFHQQHLHKCTFILLQCILEEKKTVLLSWQHQYCCLDSCQKNKEESWNCSMIFKMDTRTQFLEMCPDFHIESRLSKLKIRFCYFCLFQTCKRSSTLHNTMTLTNQSLQHWSSGLASWSKRSWLQLYIYCFSHFQTCCALFEQLQLLELWNGKVCFILLKLLLPGRAIKVSWKSQWEIIPMEKRLSRTQQ